MDFQAFLNDIRSSPDYADQIVYVRETPAREAVYADPIHPLSPEVKALLEKRGITRLYTHQAKALDLAGEGKNVLIVTGTASGKSLCYIIPLIEMLLADPEAKALLLFPTKALCQDQFKKISDLGFGISDFGSEPQRMRRTQRDGESWPGEVFPSPSIGRRVRGNDHSELLMGVYDGDTPSEMRRKLRDHGSIIFTNPDMVHASIMPQHVRWASFLSRLKLIVLDEMHVYSGIFGSNMANLMTRFFRICSHYQGNCTTEDTEVFGGGKGRGDTAMRRRGEKASDQFASSVVKKCGPQLIACSATIGNPKELAEGVTGREFEIVDNDGSPRGKRTYVFWNPPRIRERNYRSRRSANVEAHELMAMLVQKGVPTITFSKAKMTAEMIHRYVTERLREKAPHLMSKVSPYRGGYLPEERREIERRLFNGELMGVSTTPALELGIDVGGLDASIIVGYPGTLASFFQQAGRAGRQDRDALVVLVGLDTSVNQYIMSRPDYIFDRPIEHGVIDPLNPFVITGHLRCAAHEKPIEEFETGLFGPYAPMVLKILQENLKVKEINGKWYHAASETPQHLMTLRDHCDQNVVIEDSNSGKILGEVHKYDAPPMLHPEAIYMHQGDTYRVLTLDLEKNIAKVQRVEVDYYTQAIGGTDIHHVDHSLREKPFGTGKAHWGEVTAYFGTAGYEKIHFYTLDAISRHPINDMPSFSVDTMAFWIIPPEDLMKQVRLAGLDAYSGLRAIGYATRMILPLFMTCNTLDFSHTVGSVNSPWNAVFIYERYPLGLGFTEKAYERLHQIIPAVYENIKNCQCEDGCPCCVGKPLRQFTVWNVERGEGVIPSKAAALMILEGLIADGTNLECPDIHSLVDSTEDDNLKLEMALRRRLERMREPQVFHPIEPNVPTEYPEIEKPDELDKPDVTRKSERRRNFGKELRKRIAKKLDTDKIGPNTSRYGREPDGVRMRGSSLPPTAFPGRPDGEMGGLGDGEDAATRRHGYAVNSPSPLAGEGRGEKTDAPIQSGDSLAAKARRLKKGRGT